MLQYELFSRFALKTHILAKNVHVFEKSVRNLNFSRTYTNEMGDGCYRRSRRRRRITLLEAVRGKASTMTTS